MVHNYLVFQPMLRYFKRITGVGTGNYIYFWKSKGLSNENTTAPTTIDYSLNPLLSYLGTKTKVEIKLRCLRQDKITYDHGKVGNIQFFYKISKNYNISSYLTLENCLFGAVSLTKKFDIDKYKYFGYGMGFDRHGFFSHTSFGTGRNVIIFGVNMSSSTAIDNRKKDALLLGKGPTQELEDTLIAEKMYSINFTENNKKNLFELALEQI